MIHRLDIKACLKNKQTVFNLLDHYSTVDSEKCIVYRETIRHGDNFQVILYCIICIIIWHDSIQSASKEVVDFLDNDVMENPNQTFWDLFHCSFHKKSADHM